MQIGIVPKRQCSLLYPYCPPIWLAPAFARTASSPFGKGAQRIILCVGERIRIQNHSNLPITLVWTSKRNFGSSTTNLRKSTKSSTSRLVRPSIARLENNKGRQSSVEISDERLMRLVLDRLELMAKKHNNPEFLDAVGLGDADTTTVQNRFDEFWPWLVGGLQGSQGGTAALKGAPSLSVFRTAHQRDIYSGIRDRLCQSFQAFNANYAFSEQDILSQAVIADLRYPTEWYPDARKVQRTIHLHVGPTNSGKTYHALQRLERAESGIYAGPLRLLAHEIFSRLNAKGKACNLVTGDEQVMVQEGEEDAKMYSCTVEMVDFGSKVDVAVIDEIQMMAHPERGWAWTQALLGLKAKELHVCGEVRSVPIIKELAAAIGDKLIIHNYERLNPLKVMPFSLNGQLSLLQKGDAVVVFSKLGIHAMKKAIEKATSRRVAIVYGGLPPEIRAQQARLFNDENNDYDFLVASDAIGMGLNLNIKRIIFESTLKFNGSEKTVLPVSEIKQIAGRAGRYKTARDDKKMNEKTSPDLFESLSPASTDHQPGYVTCFDGRDLPIVKNAMETEAPPITVVGIAPPEDILQRFANHFPSQTPYSYVMLRMYEFARLNPRFFLCDVRDQMKIADALRPVKHLTISDLMTFCASPANLSSDSDKKFLQAMAACVAEQKDNDILDLLGYELEVLDAEISPRPEYMEALEALHRNLVLYIWLSYRFGTFFRQRPLATHAKRLVEDNINKVLTQFTSVKILDSKFKRLQKRSLSKNPPGHSKSVDQPESALKSSTTSRRASFTKIVQEQWPNPLKDSSKGRIHKMQERVDQTANPQEKSRASTVAGSRDSNPVAQEYVTRTVGYEQPPSTSTPAASQSHNQSWNELEGSGLEKPRERPAEHVEEGRWYDDAPWQGLRDMNGWKKSQAGALGAAQGKEPLSDNDAEAKQTSNSDQPKPRFLKGPRQRSQSGSTKNYEKAVSQLSPQLVRQTDCEKGSTSRPKPQAVSDFFTASDSRADKCKDTLPKAMVIKAEEKEPMVNKSPHPTTIDILNSLISRVPSLKQRSEELRR